MRRFSLAVALLCAGMVLVACDRSHTTAPPSGATVFARSCSACHSLLGNESEHKQGGDLLGYAMSRAQLSSFTAVMPARLSAAQLRAVVDYVYAAEARARRG